MGEYSSFADCTSKNKDKNDPNAYCGYIKHQIEGGKKKEEAMGYEAEHEAYHLEEEVKKLEEECSAKEVMNLALKSVKDEDKFGSASKVMNLALHKEDEEVKHLEEEITKMEEEVKVYDKEGKEFDWEGGKLTPSKEPAKKKEIQPEKPQWCSVHKKPYLEHTPDETKIDTSQTHWGEEAMLKDIGAFVNTLKATVDDITLLAKDQGWDSNSGVSEKVSPSKPTKVGDDVSGELVGVAVKKFSGDALKVQVNWFNTAMAELKDIVADANQFFEDAGWNSAEVVKEYNEHKKHWGKDYTAGT